MPSEQGFLYEIQNTMTGARYIGRCLNIEVRWSTHLRELQRGRHVSIPMQRDWNAYGPTAFTFRILAVVDGAAELAVQESAIIMEKQPAYNTALTKSGKDLHKEAMRRRAAQNAARVICTHEDEAGLHFDKARFQLMRNAITDETDARLTPDVSSEE